jgi:hypothetical protein
MNEKDLQEYVTQTKNGLRAISMLRKYTDKNILVKDIRELAGRPSFPGVESYLGASENTSENIIIYLNFSYPNTCEATFIHEMLHKILRYEGFPEVIIDQEKANTLHIQYKQFLPKLQSLFSSIIDHPEIFRRIESEFDLDLHSYYQIQVQQKINRFHKSWKEEPKNDQYYFFRQQDILIGLEYFFYPPIYKERILQVFNELSPDAYASCSSLYEKVKKIGFYTPESAHQSGKMIKAHIIRYGERKGARIFNKTWEALEIKLQ